MRISVVSISFYATLSLALRGKDFSQDVIGYLGIPYAKPPLRNMRFKDSEAISLDEAGVYIKWPMGCPGTVDERTEDCLFLSLLQMKNISKKTDTFLIFLNEKLSEKKLAGLVSPSLNIGLAAIRTGILSSFGNNSFGISDVINAVKFLRENEDILKIGKITVWAESFEAETVASAISKAGVDRAILINGNAKTRTIGRSRFSSRAAYKISTELKCDLPSAEQLMDCLRTKSLSELYGAVEKVSADNFRPFGSPFRAPSLDQPLIPTILGVFKQLPREYPDDNSFDEKYGYNDFKQALAGLLPDSQYRNAPLLRKLVLHHYVYTQGDKKNTYFLFEQMRKALLDRDFIAPTRTLVDELRKNKNLVFLFEYGIDNPPKSCLQDGGWDDIKPFCDKMFQYFTRFATKGQPTKNGCDPTDPTWPAMGTSKRDYHVILKVDGTIEWDSNFHLSSTELWNNLLPALDQLELKGRRDAIFKEEEELLPINLEDDEQQWHQKDEFDFMKEGALYDLPDHAEL